VHATALSDQQYVPWIFETGSVVQLYPSNVRQYWARLLKQDKLSYVKQLFVLL
jgi:hypothetical protein